MLTHTRTVGLAHGRQSLSDESRRASGGTIVAIVVALLAGIYFVATAPTPQERVAPGAIAIATGFAVALTGDDADAPLQTFEGWLGALLVASGAGMCAYVLDFIARRTGLRFDQDAVTYRTVFQSRSTRWEQFDGVTVSGAYPYLRLVIDGGGRRVTVNARAIGSDPSAVAAIIDFYRQHPEHRHHLTDANAAITCAERTHAASR